MWDMPKKHLQIIHNIRLVEKKSNGIARILEYRDGENIRLIILNFIELERKKISTKLIPLIDIMVSITEKSDVKNHFMSIIIMLFDIFGNVTNWSHSLRLGCIKLTNIMLEAQTLCSSTS